MDGTIRPRRKMEGYLSKPDTSKAGYLHGGTPIMGEFAHVGLMTSWIKRIQPISKTVLLPFIGCVVA